MLATATATQEFETVQADPAVRPEDAAWDAFLAAHPFGHHEQSSMYGLLRKAFGFRTERVVLRRQERIIGGAQVLWRSTPIGRIAFVKRGPIALDDDREVLGRVVDELDRMARDHRFAVMRFDTFTPQDAAREVLATKGFEPHGYWGGQSLSARILLTGGDDAILARMTPKGRYNVRRAARSGVVVRPGDHTSISEFYKLHVMSSEHQGFAIFEPGYFDYLLDVFGPSGRVQQFIAYFHDRPIAALFNTIVGDYMLYGWGGTDRGDDVHKLNASYLLHFSAMSWAGGRGCRYYDVIGVSEKTTGGLTQFKTRIAPERFHWPMAMWKFYGSMASLRSRAAEITWSMPLLRRQLTRVAPRLGLRHRMPW